MENNRIYTDSEMAASYRQAKSKRGQIRVLAELNLMTREEVEQILEREGCKMKKKNSARERTTDGRRNKV